MLIIGLDDTDNLDSRGTGALARVIAAIVAAKHPVLGVVRHQLLVDPRIRYTKNNSAAAILLDADGDVDPDALLACVRSLMLEDFQPGSDPGLCIAESVSQQVVDFARRVQREVVDQEEAYELAGAHGLPLVGLGGDNGGVVGALAAVGLAATGEDGRYVQVGRIRELAGLRPVADILAAGVSAVLTLDGQPVTDGLVQTDRLRPARRGGRPTAFVEWGGTCWLPLKLN